MNDRGEKTAWKIAPEVVDTLAAVLAGGTPALRARAVDLLEVARRIREGRIALDPDR